MAIAWCSATLLRGPEGGGFGQGHKDRDLRVLVVDQVVTACQPAVHSVQRLIGESGRGAGEDDEFSVPGQHLSALGKAGRPGGVPG
jgi:hypothetical protein